jgi:hypothetical protein
MHDRSRLHHGVLAALALTPLVLFSACASDPVTPDGATSVTNEPTGQTAPAIDPGDAGTYMPMIDPARFVAVVDNSYLSLRPGAKWVYEGTQDGEPEHTEVVVTSDRKEIAGISTTVVRDTVWVSGEMVEDTYDWYAQDVDGTVWYFGESVREYEDGEVVSTAGSWEHGVDGAMAGVVMPAQPTVGDAYRQEYYAGEAEDMAEVLRVDDAARVAVGSFEHVVVTREWTPLEPDIVEEKAYAPSVGKISEVQTAGGSGRAELVAYTPAP